MTHDHGADVTKGVILSGIHSFLCIDHELDLTVNAGIECIQFHSIFVKASEIVSTVRSSANLYRRLRDEQVCFCLSQLFHHPFHDDHVLHDLSCRFQLYWWTWESIPMKYIEQYIKVRWQSKYGMLNSLVINKDNIRAMCASDDEECKSLHDKDLSEQEWKIIEVGSYFYVFHHS